MAILYDTGESLRKRAEKCINDDFKHQAIETAQETFYQKRKALVDAEPGWQDMRTAAMNIRDDVSKNLDYYVKEFAENAEANGVQVHFAPTEYEALWEALDIFENAGANKAVKSKSMMTEEIGLNGILEEAGINVIETDCAENILQTAHDMPSHIVVPALHQTRDSIAELYRKEKGYDGDEVPEHITHFLRKMLRPEFLSAKVGIRGCNFAVAQTGSVTLVTNEGNGRMVDSFPPVQIVFVGIDRIVPTLESLDIFMGLLPRSAVGAKMTAYFSLDTGARRDGEADGPEEVHYIIMDNGRSKLANTEFEPMMRCIRCGACLNICPVYRHITGHGYGSIYPGPMGIVLTAALAGYDDIDSMTFACTLCGACTDHCPSRIPIQDLIRDHRIKMVEQGKNHKAEVPVFKAMQAMWSSRSLYMALMRVGRPAMQALAVGKSKLDEHSAWVPVLNGWTSSRDFDVLAPYRFRTWLAEHNAARKAAEQEGDE
jgi:L-lactate dehydrogenase complex protein LldF